MLCDSGMTGGRQSSICINKQQQVQTAHRRVTIKAILGAPWWMPAEATPARRSIQLISC
jgi:hypothetical protein